MDIFMWNDILKLGTFMRKKNLENVFITFQIAICHLLEKCLDWDNQIVLTALSKNFTMETNLTDSPELEITDQHLCTSAGNYTFLIHLYRGFINVSMKMSLFQWDALYKICGFLCQKICMCELRNHPRALLLTQYYQCI